MKRQIFALALITCSSFLSASSINSAGNNNEHPLSRKARRERDHAKAAEAEKAQQRLARAPEAEEADKVTAAALKSGQTSALSESIVPTNSGVLRDTQAQSNSQAATAAIAKVVAGSPRIALKRLKLAKEQYNKARLLVCYPDLSTTPTYALSPSYLATLPPLRKLRSDLEEDFVGHIYMHEPKNALDQATAAIGSAATDVDYASVCATISTRSCSSNLSD